MIRKTGSAGAFEEYRREPTVSALLFDFDIDSTRLKLLHRGYIEKILAPIIMQKGMLMPWNIAIVGHCSASGSTAHNKELSLRRAQAVALHLRLHTPLRSLRIKPTGAGEKYAKEWENRLDRSVHIKAVPSDKGVEPDDEPPPFEDKPLPPQIGEAQLFHLRFLKISKVGTYFVGKLKIVVEITDRFKQRPHRYLFEGYELGASIGLEIQVGQTLKPSDYHPFWTPPGRARILATGDFGGDAKIIKGYFAPSDSFAFGKTRGAADFNYLVKPLKWTDPGYLSFDLLASIQGPMRSTTLDLPPF